MHRVLWLSPFVLVACAPEEEDAVELGWGVPAEELGWTTPADDAAAPPPLPLLGATLVVRDALVAGGSARIDVRGAAPGSTAHLLASVRGPGVGPCHPQMPAVCADVLSPVVVDSARVGAGGTATFVAHVPASASGQVWLQLGIVDGASSGTSAVVADVVTHMSADWVADDRLEITVTDGESGYDFGMAETGAGVNGWYEEDCVTGMYCHSVLGAQVRALRSVHPAVGGPGLQFVIADRTTLFYGGPNGIGGLGGGPDGDHPSLTYYLLGHDTGECWTFGHDPTYFENLANCAALN